MHTALWHGGMAGPCRVGAGAVAFRQPGVVLLTPDKAAQGLWWQHGRP